MTPSPFNPRRLALGAAKKLIFENEDPQTALERLAGLSSLDDRGALSAESTSMSRMRSTILNDLDEMYREAFERAKATGDQTQMATRAIWAPGGRHPGLLFHPIFDIELRLAEARFGIGRPRLSIHAADAGEFSGTSGDRSDRRRA